MKNVYDLATEDTRLTKVTSKEYTGSCPRCNSTDSFHVQPERRKGGAWMCRKCWDAPEKGWGDAIEYLRQMRNMSFQDAKALLAEQVDDAIDRVDTARQKQSYGEAPSLAWQEQAQSFIDEAYEHVWNSEGVKARAYLYKRGLKEETIDNAYLGYQPEHRVHIGEGVYRSLPVLVIPWRVDGQLWRVNVRNLHTPIPPDESKYYNRFGGSNYGLYNADMLAIPRYTFLVESELDALTLMQESGDFVNAVATGSTHGSRTPYWTRKLAQIPHIFVAYDDDKSGENDSHYWLQKLDNSERYRPIAHDINEMLTSGYDVQKWTINAIEQDRCVRLEPYWAACAEEDERRLQQEEAQESMPLYVPVSLPALPRSLCPFQCIQILGRDQRLQLVSCNKKTLENGWCEEHTYAQLFLDMGAVLDYPRIELSEYTTIERGTAAWEDYAIRVPYHAEKNYHSLKDDLPRIKAMLDA